jgi:serine/threonine protein kinase
MDYLAGTYPLLDLTALGRQEDWEEPKDRNETVKSCPHITSVHDFGVHRAADGRCTPYLVMELLDGELLNAALRPGPLVWQRAVAVCAQLASALQAAHSRGIVHRDVTPANVMLTSAGVKVLDFGISALIGATQSADRREVFGTAAYLAPERLIQGNTSAATDVYAAGLVLYRCLTGQLPWPATTIIEMLYAHAPPSTTSVATAGFAPRRRRDLLAVSFPRAARPALKRRTCVGPLM